MYDFVPLPFITDAPGSRLYTDGSTTQGLRTLKTSLLYCDLSAISISAWVYRTGSPAGGRGIVYADDNNGSHGWWFRLNNAGAVPFEFTTVGGSNTVKMSTSGVPLNVWTHCVARDSSLSSNLATNIDFVVNGVQDAGTSATNGSGHATGTPLNLTIGNSNNAGGAPPMAIAHVAIWNYKIPDAMAADLAAGASPLQYANGLVGYWKMAGRDGHLWEEDLSGVGYPVYAFSTGAPAWYSAPPVDINDPEAPSPPRYFVAGAAPPPTTVVERRTFGSIGRVGTRRAA